MKTFNCDKGELFSTVMGVTCFAFFIIGALVGAAFGLSGGRLMALGLAGVVFGFIHLMTVGYFVDYAMERKDEEQDD